MPQQTRTFQTNIIKQYQQCGQLEQLYYYVEIELPTTLRATPKARYMPATYPAGHIPVIPIAPNPAIARDWAHMLLELFKASNPNRNITFDIVVTDAKALTGWYYYEWGNECTALVDKACPNCGMIQTIPANIELDCDCSVGSGATQLGLYRTYRTFVDDTIYTTIITR